MKKLYLCRHGETAWTLSGQHTGKTDIPLTEKGKEQAILLKKRLEKVSFDAVFSSPKKRACESCIGMKYEIDPNIQEWDYGDFEGKTTLEIHKVNPTWNLFQDGAPNGETAEEVGKRADAFLKKALAYSGNVAVFSHGHFLRVLTARFLGLKPQMGKHLFLSVASTGILGFERESPVIILWNETTG